MVKLVIVESPGKIKKKIKSILGNDYEVITSVGYEYKQINI